MSARLEALLLDAAGTALELREPAAAVYVRIAARHGIERPLADVARALAGARIAPPPLDGVALADVPAREREGWREIARAALGDEAADGPCFDAIFAAFARADAWRPVSGVREALDQARARGLRTAIVSNMDSRLPALLEELGLGDALDAVVLPSSCGFAKPDPRIFAFALAELGLRAEAALYVGDREPDCVAAARAAGLRAWRYDPRAPAGAPEVLADWAELATRL
ncbi:MAG: HAD-IA family hydrolase [Myxococcota bacterium]